jgi:hypothetical protein
MNGKAFPGFRAIFFRKIGGKLVLCCRFAFLSAFSYLTNPRIFRWGTQQNRTYSACWRSNFFLPERFHGKGRQFLYRSTSLVSGNCVMEMPPYSLDRNAFWRMGLRKTHLHTTTRFIKVSPEILRLVKRGVVVDFMDLRVGSQSPTQVVQMSQKHF